MHVPWGWIKQRPHFLAELLSQDYNVEVFYKKSFNVSSKNLLNKREDNYENLSINRFLIFPFNRFPILRNLEFLNTFFIRYQLPKISVYDYVWITSPLLYSIVKPLLKKSKIIYDCMDDAAEFPLAKRNVKLCSHILKSEAELLKDADIVFCSSDYLKAKILDRAHSNRKVTVVNNAISLPNVDNKYLCNEVNDEILSKIEKLSYPLLYIGTISEWFDFNMMLLILDKFPEINLVLIGPSDCMIPSHPRIHHLGTVERKYIYTIMDAAWALIMPFVVDELIRSVNPVKMYEYIYMRKNIIAPFYSEMKKFSSYAYLYKTESELELIISNLLTNKQGVTESAGKEMQIFAENNTWDSRYNQIKKELR